MKTKDVDLRAVVQRAAPPQVDSLADYVPGPDRVPEAARSLLTALIRHARRALATPADRAAKDAWDLAVFGHHGTVAFTGITQPWLRERPSGGPPTTCPRNRGAGAPGGLAASIIGCWSGCRRRCGCGRPRRAPAALGRADIEAS